jgi:hypothetical protein
MNFNFGEVLTRAWQIIWKHKILWVFGILAGCGQGGGGGNSGGGGEGGFGQTDLPPQVMRWFQFIEENLVTILVIFFAVVCVIWIITIFLNTIGKIGLIRGTAQADDGAESLVFGQLFSESIPYFWRMFVLSLILSIPILVGVVAFGMGLAAFAFSASGGSDSAVLGLAAMIPLFICCICLLIPVMFVIGMIFRQAQNAIVLENLDVLPALSRGWQVFRDNLGPILLMAIILVVIGLVAGFVIAIPVFVIVFPTMFAFVLGQGQNTTPLILMGLCFCVYIPVALVLNGILMSYAEAAWTLTYIRLTRKPEDNPTEDDPKDIDDNRTIIGSVNA